MHFNDLLIKIRSGALGAVAAVSAGAGVFLKIDSATQWGALAAIFFILIAFWTAIYQLDLYYYNRLLLGAVNALKALENTVRPNDNTETILLSTFIDKAVEDSKILSFDNEGNEVWSKWRGSIGVRRFYGIVFVTLLICFLFCGCAFTWQLYHPHRFSWVDWILKH